MQNQFFKYLTLYFYPVETKQLTMMKLQSKQSEYLKLVSAIFYQVFIFSPNDSPLKTVKNVFYFI